MKRYLWLAILTLLLGTVGLAAPIKVIPVVPHDPIDRLAQTAVVLEPWHYENLTIYPVRLTGLLDAPDVLTMDEAMDRGVLYISETGSVNEVIANNRGGRPVFLMAGELIGGAKQDRTIRDDALIGPNGRVRVAVYCVEAHRWTGGAEFSPLKGVLSGQIRQSARAKASQQAVWGAVAEAQEAAKAPSATGAFRSVYESRDVQRTIIPYKEKMGPMLSRHRDVYGVIVVAGGRLVVADIFGDRSVFERLWSKLLDSYAVSTFQVSIGQHIWSREDAQRLVRRIAYMRQSNMYTSGLGRLVRLEGGEMLGSALVWDYAVMHLELFPGGPRILPMEQRPLPSPDQRRQRLEERIR